MTKEWTPSWLGRRLTGSPEWRLLRKGFELSLAAAGQSHCINVEDETSYRVQRGYFWTDITLHPGQTCEVQVDGLPNFQGARLISALAAEKQIREDVAFLQSSHQAMSEWLRQKMAQERAAKAERRWFTHEMQMALEAARPTIDVSTFRARLKKPEVRIRLGEEATTLDESLTLWDANHRVFWSKLNAVHTARELEACKDLFDKVESKPLTEEQAQAVVCFDNRVQGRNARSSRRPRYCRGASRGCWAACWCWCWHWPAMQRGRIMMWPRARSTCSQPAPPTHCMMSNSTAPCVARFIPIQPVVASLGQHRSRPRWKANWQAALRAATAPTQGAFEVGLGRGLQQRRQAGCDGI